MFNNDCRGNVLFLILIAVALFAALAYAITSSQRGSRQTISEDKAKLLALEIVQFANLMGNTATKLRVSGCSDTEISYRNTRWVTDTGTALVAENPNAPSDKKCHLFDSGGAGLTPYPLSPAVSQGETIPASGAMAGMPFIRSLQVEGAGTTASDVVMVVNYINPKVCEAINKSIGIPLPTTGDDKTGWTANYWMTNISAQIGEEDVALQGHPYFCWKNTADNQYTFAYLLMVR